MRNESSRRISTGLLEDPKTYIRSTKAPPSSSSVVLLLVVGRVLRRRPPSSPRVRLERRLSKVWQLVLNHACFKSPPSFINSSHQNSLPSFFWTLDGGGGEKKRESKKPKKNSKRRRRRRHDEDGRRCDYHHHLLLLLLLLPSFDDWRALGRVGRVLFRVQRKNAAAVFFSRSESDKARQKKHRQASGFNSTSRRGFFPRNAPFGIDSDGQSR